MLSGCETLQLDDPSPTDPAASSTAPAQAGGSSDTMVTPTPVSTVEPVQQAQAPLGDLGHMSDTVGTPVSESEIFRGTGVLAKRPPSRTSDAEILANGDVTLNFVNAEIREVVDAVLGQALGLSYIIDPKVQGQVTARTSRPIPRRSVIPALENILALNGAALTLDNGVYKIVTLQQAATSLSTPVLQPNRGEVAQGFGVHIFPVRYASALELSEVLRPFIGPGRVFRADPGRNLLVFGGTSTEARDLGDMITVFDVDWMAGMSFALFPLQVAEATTVVEDLNTVFLQEGASPLAGVIRFVPIDRLNAILVISPQATYIDRAQTWIDRLDRGGEGTGRRIFVYRVQNGRAADLAEVLSQIFDIAADLPEREIGTGLAPGVSAVTLGEQPRREDVAAGQEGAAPEPTPVAAPIGAPESESLGSLDDLGNVRIIADETTNSLVILATATEYRMIEATLKRLDIIPLQVLIEVTIAEVTLNDDLEFGVEWFFRANSSEFAFTTGTVATPLQTFPGFSYLFEIDDARVVLNALSSITDVRVVSSPQLMVLDNQSARLQVGDEVPIATQSAVSVTDPDAPIVNSIEFRDTGVILEITPRVNASGLVTLDVLQEVSDVIATTTSAIDSPTISQRSVESTVAVQSGDTVALGGLIEDSNEEAVSGLPLLSEIPILGNLFKSSSNSVERTELLILITPRVVRDRREALDVTDELRRRLTGIVPLERKVTGFEDAPGGQ